MSMFQGSRYIHTPALVRDGKSLILGIRTRYKFSEDKCSMYTVTRGDTLDGIAYKQYGNAYLGWAILDANPKYRTEFDIKNGDVILIPDYEEVVSLVNV